MFGYVIVSISYHYLYYTSVLDPNEFNSDPDPQKTFVGPDPNPY